MSTKYSFEIELVPTLWLKLRPAETRLLDLAGAHPWRASRHSAAEVAQLLDRVALRADTESKLLTRWGVDESECIELQQDYGRQLVSLRARLDCRRINETVLDVVFIVATKFELSAVSADGIIRKADAAAIKSAAMKSQPGQLVRRPIEH